MPEPRRFNPYPEGFPSATDLVALAGALGCVVYAVATRTLLDFAIMSPVVSLPFYVLVLRERQALWEAPKSWRPLFVWNARVGTFLLLPLAAGAFYYCVVAVLLDVFAMAARHMSAKGQFSVATAIFTLAAGCALFLFRMKWRCSYGVSEVLVGLVIASSKAYDVDRIWIPLDGGFYAALLTAGVYLVVRGLDNAQQGLDSDRDPMARMYGRIFAKPLQMASPRRLKRPVHRGGVKRRPATPG